MTLAEFTDRSCANGEVSRDTFYVTIIYDTAGNGFAAMRVCQQLIETFGAELLFQIAVCDLNSFERRHEYTPAMKAAKKATLVLVATNGPLPERLIGWLNGWALNAGKPAAIGLMTNGDRCARAYLQRLCATHGIDMIEAEGLTAWRIAGLTLARGA